MTVVSPNCHRLNEVLEKVAVTPSGRLSADNVAVSASPSSRVSRSFTAALPVPLRNPTEVVDERSRRPGPAPNDDTSSNGSSVLSRSLEVRQSNAPAARMAERTSAGVVPGCATRNSAAAPATCGVAMDVPEIVAYVLPR